MTEEKESAPLIRPSFLESFWNSAVNFSFYRRVWDQPFGRSLRYLVFLALCLSLLVSWRMIVDFNRSASDWGLWLCATIPDIKISNGLASLPSGKPKSIMDEKAILILDPLGGHTTFDAQYRTGMILAKDKVMLKWNQAAGPSPESSRLEKLIYTTAYAAYILRPESFHGNEFQLAGIRSLDINSKNIVLWQETARSWVGISLPVIYFIFYLAGKLLQALFFSLVLAYSHRMMREQGMTYSRVLNLAIYALTPSAFFSAVVQAAGLQVPYVEWIVLGMYVAFLMGAMNACIVRRPAQDNSQDRDNSGPWDGF